MIGRTMSRLAPLLALFALASPVAAEGVAGVSSVDTALRTLLGCPRKGVIAKAEDWARVVDGLEGAPPVPDFAAGSVVLLVVELPPGGEARVTSSEPAGKGWRLVVERTDPEPPKPGETRLRCFFALVPSGLEGVEVEVKTEIWDGGGFISTLLVPTAHDLDPARLPTLGPDVRLSVAPPRGAALPAELFLRHEATFPTRSDLPKRITTDPWPAGGRRIGMRLPRVRDGVEHLFAAHGSGLRSRNALVIKQLPDPDGSGSPRPIAHTFQLEPIPE